MKSETIKSYVRTIYGDIDSICTKWSQYRAAFDRVMKDTNLSSEGKMDKVFEEKKNFFANVGDCVSRIDSCMTHMIELVDSEAVYNPADPALHNAIAVVKNPKTPWRVIEQTRAYFMGNDAAEELLASECAKEFTGYFKAAVYDQNKRTDFQKAINAIGTAYPVTIDRNTSPDVIMGVLSNVDDQVRVYCQLRCVNDDFIKPTMDRLKEELVTARVIMKNEW